MAELVTIPGDPAALEGLAGQLRGAAADIEAIHGRVTSNTLEGSWSGHASSAFRGSLQALPGELDGIVTAFGAAATALGSFAGHLAELQQAAARHNQQVEQSEQELRAAQAHASEREAGLRAARSAHATASDPLTLSTATRALEASETFFHQAVMHVESLGSQMSQMLAGGGALTSEYDQAVQVCCSALDAARHAAGRSFTSWLDREFHHIVHHAERIVTAAIRGGEEFVSDPAKWLDRHWEAIRKGLTVLGDVLAVASLVVAFVAIAVLTGGGGIPFEIAAASAILGASGLAVSGAAWWGDSTEANRGDAAARGRLGSDGVGFALSAVSAICALAPEVRLLDTAGPAERALVGLADKGALGERATAAFQAESRVWQGLGAGANAAWKATLEFLAPDALGGVAQRSAESAARGLHSFLQHGLPGLVEPAGGSPRAVSIRLTAA